MAVEQFCRSTKRFLDKEARWYLPKG